MSLRVRNCRFILIIHYYYYFFDPGTQFPGNEKKLRYKYKNQTGINLTPPPPPYYYYYEKSVKKRSSSTSLL